MDISSPIESDSMQLNVIQNDDIAANGSSDSFWPGFFDKGVAITTLSDIVNQCKLFILILKRNRVAWSNQDTYLGTKARKMMRGRTAQVGSPSYRTLRGLDGRIRAGEQRFGAMRSLLSSFDECLPHLFPVTGKGS